LSFVPIRGLQDVVLRFWAGNDFPFHDFDRDRRRAFNSSSGIEEFGSA
jgi:hypothetical protein